MEISVFELPEIAKVLEMPLTKARNWTIGRPLSIPASIRPATGTGSRNLYSIEDVYLMALANEFSKAGFAAKAIGKLLEVVEAKKLAEIEWLTVWRGKNFNVIPGKTPPPPEGVLVWHTVNVGRLVKLIDKALEKSRRKKS
jgi:DNA-binding transcriptional MerR regulator